MAGWIISTAILWIVTGTGFTFEFQRHLSAELFILAGQCRVFN
jgi:hypothetical protein